MGAAILIPVVVKQTKRMGTVYPAQETDYSVEVVPGKSISIFEKGTLLNVMEIGDLAEYDSYNLSYFGPIVKITDKAVTIAERHGAKRLHRLDFNTFCWRNKHFDAKKAEDKNFETMQYL